ncbi:MFS transporter [Streptomyces sp. NBC_01716]|uniref:MFS transporter n=1 Tax=Streptomyces sp. NBC_01716 TaxID=2975917 RepID=UPI002E342211|nr:MFS transporter [Streptomyces sp. NBC_01716]
MTAAAVRRWPLTAVLTANAISALGRTLSLIGIPWFVLQTTGSAGRAGVVAFCATLPVVLSALIGGPVIDRIGRRRVSIASDTLCALSVGAVPLLHRSDSLPFWGLCALVALHGLAHTPGDTARYVLVPDLAEQAGTTLVRAASLFDAVERGARMLGAALAGLVIALLGAEVALLLDALTYLLSALLVGAGLRGIRGAQPVKGMPRVSPRTYAAELREGYAYLARTRLLAAVVIMVMFMNGIDQGWNGVLLPVHAERNLGGAAELGLVTAVFGAGGLLGALLYCAVGHQFARRTVLAVAVLLCGAPRFAVAGLTDSTAALAVIMGAAGVAGGMINPILTTVTYERVPDELRSRVAGAMTAGCELTMPLGALTAGLLVEGTSLSTALLLMGGVYLLATLSPALLPVWRGLDEARRTTAMNEGKRPSTYPARQPSRET